MMSREWLTAAEILPFAGVSLPASMSKLQELASATWRADPRRFRIRQGRGGGVEYHVSLLPPDVRARISASEIGEIVAPEGRSNALWSAFERLPDATKAKATERLQAVQAVTAFGNALTRQLAVLHVAQQFEISTSTLWSWLGQIDGLAEQDWLAALAPRHAGRTSTAECDPRAWDHLVCNYLRLEQPNFARCYDWMLQAATAEGWSPLPSSKTLKRRLEREYPTAARMMAREGETATARIFPAQRRDRSCFRAMQAVNADGHKFDVFVRRASDGAISRMILTGFQDLYSGMILSHRLDWSENTEVVRLAFADMVRDYGVPEQCWLDNGRHYASKKITGGQLNRYRFKVRPEEPDGIMTNLGVKVHFTTPYHGQAKPIERAWRDLCEEIAKHPACAGAYTGNTPQAKPENYGSKAIPEDVFRHIVATEIAAHNARPGRRTATAKGRSFLETFKDSLALPDTLIRRVTDAQRRLLLLAAEGVMVKSKTAEIELMGTRYGADALADMMGKRVVARFDPQNLAQPLAVYTLDGRFVCEADVIGDVMFETADHGRDHTRKRKDFLRKQRDFLAAEQRLTISQVAAMLPESTAPTLQPSKVVRMVAGGGRRPEAGDWSGSEDFSRGMELLAAGQVLPFARKEEAD